MTLRRHRRSGPWRARRTTFVDHEFDVPLDHDDPAGATTTVFAREVVATGRLDDDLPWLLFLQGGPGGKPPRSSSGGDWLSRAVEDRRVLLLDQRGTGLSGRLNRQTLPTFGAAHQQAELLRHFRADSIVRDAELIRRELLGEDRRWSVLGQSYGGFCVLTYLSFAPRGLDSAYVAGGLPSLRASAEDVYRHTYPRVRDKCRAYYARYPDDVDRMRAVGDRLRREDVRLPGGDPLTVRRLRTLGMRFGMSDGYEAVHFLLEEAWAGTGESRQLSDTFLDGVQRATGFVDNPLYAVLQEPIYCQGQASSRWAAHRVLEEFPDFDDRADPPLLTGEMMYPWMFEEYGELRPLREAAEHLAHLDDWPPLYDPRQLAVNDVPAAAVVYHDDMYVDAGLSLETARSVRGLKAWVTNEYEHDGVRVAGARVLGRLLDLAAGRD